MPWIAGLHLVWSLESAIQFNLGLVFLHVPQWLMSCFGFTQHHAKAASAKTESLLDASSHRHPAAVGGHTKILPDHPHAARSAINLKQPITERCNGIGGLPPNGYFLAGM